MELTTGTVTRRGVAAALAAATLLTACRAGSAARPPVDIEPPPTPEPTAASPAPAARGALVQFQLAQFAREPWIQPRQVFLHFSDDDSTRWVPGEILALSPGVQARMPGGRNYPTATAGTLHVAVDIQNARIVEVGQHVLASAEVDLPLRPDWLWSVLVSIRPQSMPMLQWSFSGPVAASVTFHRPGDPPADSLVLRIQHVGSPLSRLILR